MIQPILEGGLLFFIITTMVLSIAFLWERKLRRRVEVALADEQCLRAQAEDDALHDPLTRVYNRRFFNLELAREMARLGRGESAALAAIFVDVDHLKLLNDTHGHLEGDRALLDVANRLQGLRSGDTVARLGGDEFVILIPGLLEEEIPAVLDRLAARAGVEDIVNKRVSFSLGFSFTHEAMDPEEFLSQADAALYLQKNNGRCYAIG
jgi:diguanylate cyclase (GGDEF)-like protein